MSSTDNKFKKVLLDISIILGISFLAASVLLFLQIDTILGRNTGVNIEEWEPTPEEQRIIDELPESDGYTLRRHPTEYQIRLFETLVHAHNQFYETESDVDLKNYATAIARNFVADFFTFSNKSSRTDVGGLQFLSEDLVADFRVFAVDEFYLYLNQYIEMFGREALPSVDSTTILRVEFEYRFIEAEEEDELDNEPVFDMFGQLILPGEDVRTIVVDVEWSYTLTTLPNINEFQTTARLILLETEDGVRVYAIEQIVDEMENQPQNSW